MAKCNQLTPLPFKGLSKRSPRSLRSAHGQNAKSVETKEILVLPSGPLYLKECTKQSLFSYCDEHGDRWAAAGARGADHPQTRAAHAHWDSDVTTSRQPTAHSLSSLQWCVSFRRPRFTGENSTVCDVTAPTNYRLHTKYITPTLFLCLSGVWGC